MNSEAPPDKIIVRAGRTELALVFAQATLAIGAPRLRAACRCADCRRERIDRDADPDTGGATIAGTTIARTIIAEVRLVGDHAVNIAFSDGHDRGIYPWSYLRELARNASSDAG
jgi:DUF971 family protein